MKEQKFNNELQNARNVAEMLEIINKFYAVENCTPGQITKSTLINGLKTAIRLTGAKLR